MKKSAQTFTLLVWEEVPEETKLYLIPNAILEEEHRQELSTAHFRYVNGARNNTKQEEATLKIYNAVCDDPLALSPEYPSGSKWAMIWGQFRVSDGRPIADKIITHVYVSGFIL